MLTRPETAERCLILMPVGRDAAACALLLRQAGIEPEVCDLVEDLLQRLDRGTEVVLLTEEALYGKGADAVAAWVARQEPWSTSPSSC